MLESVRNNYREKILGLFHLVCQNNLDSETFEVSKTDYGAISNIIFSFSNKSFCICFCVNVWKFIFDNLLLN